MVQTFFPENFLETATHYYDIILFEGDGTSNNKQILFFTTTQHEIYAMVGHYIHQKKHILLILNDSSIDTILPITENGNITIVNTHAGLSAFAQCGRRDYGDIDRSMSYGFEAYEPHTTENFLETLTKAKSKTYIKTNSQLIGADNYPSLKAEGAKKTLFSLQAHGLSGGYGTVIGLGSSILHLFHASVIIQEAAQPMDFFVSSAVNIEFSEALITSLRQSESLYIVADQKQNLLWESSIKAKLRDLGLFETSIHILSPLMDKITSFLPEYIYEQSEMDGKGLAKRLLGK